MLGAYLICPGTLCDGSTATIIIKQHNGQLDLSRWEKSRTSTRLSVHKALVLAFAEEKASKC